ncbi:MAG: sigma-70 family RNA polymerase sigma factor [Pirellulales bacterium]
MSRVQPSTGFDPARLVACHERGVWRYLRALGCNPQLAEDLTQETFLAVLERPFEDYHAAATAAYLRRVARNMFVNHLRRADDVRLMANLDAVDAQWTRWVANDNGETLLAALRDCLEQLGDRPQRAFELRFQEKKSRAEIAAALGLSEDGAKNLMQRAKSVLRTCIQRKLE